jgi:heterodisulfide reductase subunit A-like polyferredoxin/coenzyme F420-reducing hydrogenase delta subunit/glycine cleavage system H lipoate-binding protein
MNLANPLKELNVLIMHGPELVAAGLDIRDFSRAVADLPNCRVLPVDPALSAAAQEEQVRTFLQADQEIKPVVLAAKDPEHRGAGVARLLMGELGLNPEFLMQVDLTAALEHPDQGSRTAKGLEMIRLAASRASRAWPIVSHAIPVSRQVLVWGDSYAGLRTAWELAELGYPVILANPNQGLTPLPLESCETTTSPDLLVRQAQEHDLIRIINGAKIRDFSGVTGNFRLCLATLQGRMIEQAGALVLAPELELQEAPPSYHAPEHPGVISLNRMEELLAGGDKTDIPGAVAFLIGLAGYSQPLPLERALKTASQLLAAGSRVYLLVGDAKLAGPGLQRAMQGDQEAGLVLFKLNECPTISLGDDGLLLSFFEPTLRRNLGLRVDLAVYDDQYRAAEDNVGLAELLRLPIGPGGFLQAGNVHHLPVVTSRRGIYVVGPGRGIMDLNGTETDISAAVSEIQGLLGQGEALAPQGRAAVDRGKCALCLTCHRLCPHGAITWDNRVIINELACQGCGVCASQCPQNAIQVRNFTDDQVAAQLAALEPQLGPRIVAFMCRNSAWEAYQTAVRHYAASLPLGFTPIKVPCAGKIDPDYLLQAFTSGADGVLVLSCPQDNCKSTHGNICAQWGVEQVQGLLAEAGIDPGRLLFNSLAANAPRDLIDSVEQLLANLSFWSYEKDDEYPFWLTTEAISIRPPAGGQRPQATRFLPANQEVCIEINARDARQLGIQAGEQIETSSRTGTITATAYLNDRVRPGTALFPRRSGDDAIKLLPNSALEPGVRRSVSHGCAVRLAKLMDQLEEVFGLNVPTSRYLHRGHTWVALESDSRVRLGLDDFSQKVLGPGDEIKLPAVGEEIRREEAVLGLSRRGQMAAVLAPMYGVIEAVNPKVLARPGLAHDDPYGDGWLMVVAPTNLQPDLRQMICGEDNTVWMEEETLRLLEMLEPAMGATLPSGGGIIDDVYGQFPQLGWERLVREFLRSV